MLVAIDQITSANCSWKRLYSSAGPEKDSEWHDEATVAPEGKGTAVTRDVVGGAQPLLSSHPAIGSEETRDPVAQEGPETFSFVPCSARATGDEPRSLLISHDWIVVLCRPTGVLRPCAPHLFGSGRVGTQVTDSMVV